MPEFDYIRDPDEIYRQSFATIDAVADLTAFSVHDRAIVKRIIHACGMPEIVDGLVCQGEPGLKGRAALEAGAPILVDVEMVAHGIIQRVLPKRNAIVCSLKSADVPTRAAALGTTRSAAAVDDWVPHLEGAVVAIGNAPTALFRLLELMASGCPKPAVIVGLPVGFIGAAESKQALIAHAGDTPFITLPDRRGGSAMAAAAVNALSAGAGE